MSNAIPYITSAKARFKVHNESLSKLICIWSIIPGYLWSLIFSITARPSKEKPVLQTTRARVPNQNQFEELFHLLIMASPSKESPKPITKRLTTEYINDFFIVKIKKFNPSTFLCNLHSLQSAKLHKHLNKRIHRNHKQVDKCQGKRALN